MTTTSGTAEPSVRRIALVGLAAGLLSGMFGVGGGILIVPGLVLVAKMDQRTAHGTSLAAVLPIAVSSFLTYFSNDLIDWPVAIWLAVGAVAGTVLGTKLLNILPLKTLALSFAGLLVATAARLFFQGTGQGRGTVDAGIAVALVLIGLATGILAGLLGVGGGVVMVPALMLALSLPGVIAKGTSVAVIIPTSIMGTIRNRKKANADLRAAGIVGAGGIISAVAGGWVSVRMDDALSNVLFACLLLLVAARLVRDVRAETRAGELSTRGDSSAGSTTE
ncbi:MAG: sulfite exporter TauE/SafE family protein [Actinobacteria bacterium]|nr:sulfite exporter TauE/SafE family protein [Actinomycetota bacterium]